MKTFWPNFDIGLCQSRRDSSDADSTCRKMSYVSNETKLTVKGWVIQFIC